MAPDTAESSGRAWIGIILVPVGCSVPALSRQTIQMDTVERGPGEPPSLEPGCLCWSPFCAHASQAPLGESASMLARFPSIKWE